MRTLLGIGLVLGLGLVSVTGTARAEDKYDAKKLVGKWEPKEAQKGKSMVMEFTKDGKLIITARGEGKEVRADGTYKLDGDKLSFELKAKDPKGQEQTIKETVTITKLTEEELEGKGKDGKTESFKKVKARDK